MSRADPAFVTIEANRSVRYLPQGSVIA